MTSIKTGLPKHWISALFKIFQARYAHKWTSAIEGNEEFTVGEWSERLAGLTGEQIKHGKDTWDGSWPPSSEEFRASCLGTDSRLNEYGMTYVPAYYSEENRITSQSRLLSSGDRDRRRNSAKGHIKNIKSIIKKVK